MLDQKLCAILLFVLMINKSESFVPKDLIETAIKSTNNYLDNSFGYVTETFTHEEIIRRGIIRSVTKYFYDQPGGRQRIDLKKIESDYYHSIKRLFHEFYDKWFCKIGLEELIEDIFQKMVVNVDLNDGTKDLPYAHFDAEFFRLSNDRVILYKERISKELRKKNKGGYRQAAKLTGIIMHTIHDFYSHSNWVEMGNYNELNHHIGKKSFNKQEIAGKDDPTCYENCVLIKQKCDSLSNVLSNFVNALELKSIPISCPIEYFECTNNLARSKKLISGFYVNQRLTDGTLIEKPLNKKKCSHGGIMDATSYISPKGGINKDSGYLILSPHAHLHQIAAQLAIRHTELFFNEIRTEIGDVEFAKFLKLNKPKHLLNKFNQHVQLCGSYYIKYSILNISCLFLGNLLLFVFYF